MLWGATALTRDSDMFSFKTLAGATEMASMLTGTSTKFSPKSPVPAGQRPSAHTTSHSGLPETERHHHLPTSTTDPDLNPIRALLGCSAEASESGEPKTSHCGSTRCSHHPGVGPNPSTANQQPSALHVPKMQGCTECQWRTHQVLTLEIVLCYLAKGLNPYHLARH